MGGDAVSAVTDLALGAVAACLWWALLGRPGRGGLWSPVFGLVAVAALGGAVFHSFTSRDEASGETLWNLIGLALVLSLGFLAAASLAATVANPPAWVQAAVPVASGGLYVVLAAVGSGGPEGVALASAPANVATVVLWLRALARRHPRAPAVLVAMVASGLAAAARAGAVAADSAALHPDGVYHLAQIPGLVLLYLAVGRDRPWLRFGAGAPA